MNGIRHTSSAPTAELAQISNLAHPLAAAPDLDPLIQLSAAVRYVCLGEASHGTQEYYRWRAIISRRLIEERGFTWIGVEGDWPDCWRINRWVRGHEGNDLDAYQLLAGFERWPTWMWSNYEVAEFLTWLREWNLHRPEREQPGFYGLDVYSLWDSLRDRQLRPHTHGRALRRAVVVPPDRRAAPPPSRAAARRT